MWTNELLQNNNGELFVRFTSPSNKTFVKKYNVNNVDIETFLAQKISDIETLSETFESIKSVKNIEQEITDGWTFALIFIDMKYDYIEVIVEVITPTQTLHKMYQIIAPRSPEYVYAWIEAEKNKLANLINADNIEALSDYFGMEVTLDG